MSFSVEQNFCSETIPSPRNISCLSTCDLFSVSPNELSLLVTISLPPQCGLFISYDDKLITSMSVLNVHLLHRLSTTLVAVLLQDTHP